jgi:hypothetical protein
MSDEDALNGLIHDAQRSKRKRVIFQEEDRRRVWVYRRSRHRITQEWLELKCEPVVCKLELGGLAERERDNAVIAAGLETGIGVTPDFILGYEWVDPDSETKQRRMFPEPFSRA